MTRGRRSSSPTANLPVPRPFQAGGAEGGVGGDPKTQSHRAPVPALRFPSNATVETDPNQLQLKREIRSQILRLAGYAEPGAETAEDVSKMENSVKAIARPAASRSLGDAIREARLEEAERLDRTADHRDGEMARLELLRAELETIFAEIPRQDDRFNLTLVPSRPARLWIDLFTYVAIDEGSGAYLFVRNSENGRRTLFSATNVADMADRITTYVAHEIVRRERMETALQDRGGRSPMTLVQEPAGSLTRIVFLAFVIGVLTGAVGLFAAVWLSAT